MSFLVNSYRYASSDLLWDQTDDTEEFLFNSYVTAANFSPDAGSSFIGKTLKTFTMTLAYNTTPSNAPVTFGVWAKLNINRTTPDTEFECTSHSLTNFNQLTAGYITYTFQVKAPATGHTLVALDSIGYCYNSAAGTNGFQKEKRANGASVSGLSSTIWYNSSPEKWHANNPLQVPFGSGSSV